MLDPTSSVRAASALRGALLGAAARAHLAGDINPRRLVDALGAAGAYGDAVKVIARVLPKQYALAWACECVRGFLVPGLPSHDADRAGLALAEGWLREPTEDNRRAALDFAERGEFEGVGAWVAAAAGWTGGSIAPKGYDAVPPGEYLTADAIAATLALLAAQAPEEIPARLAAFVQKAIAAFGKTARAPAGQPG